MHYLVMYSGGAGSWAAAKRTVERVGRRNVTGVFADTFTEDEDLYRFLDDSASNLGIGLVRIADGRDVWQVFQDERFIGNTRVDPCSRVLKRDLIDRWRNRTFNPDNTTLVFGLDWAERHRIEGRDGGGGFRRRMEASGWKCDFPLNERPYLTKQEIIEWMEFEGVKPPRLYYMDFPHNNCGGFCVKAGLGQFRHLLRVMPERYAYHEQREAEVMAAIGPTAKPFLKLRRGGKTEYVTLRHFREMHEQFPLLGADHGWGCGGGCAVDDGSEGEDSEAAA